MITARDLLRKRTYEIWSVAPDATVMEALKRMAEANTGALLVMVDDQVEGIITERDCIRKVEIQGRTVHDTLVKEIMTEKVMYVDASELLEQIMAIMTEKGIRHMPVFDGSKLLGVISIRDVLREVADEQKFLISQLQRYIAGG
jgi:CBS domain-containing protein